MYPRGMFMSAVNTPMSSAQLSSAQLSLLVPLCVYSLCIISFLSVLVCV